MEITRKSEKPNVKPIPKVKPPKKKRKFKFSVRTGILAVSAVILVGLLGFLVYKFHDDMLVLVPGYYQNYQYNQITSKKNDLIDDNADLLEENTGLETSLDVLGLAVEDFETRTTTYAKMTENLQKVKNNLEKIVGYDDDLKNMRLPYVITEYIKLSKTLDELRLKEVGVSLTIAQSRSDLNDINKKRAEFDACLGAINWSDSDANISAAITVCNTKNAEMRTLVTAAETKYSVKLEQISKYFELLEAQWKASADYYTALGAKDYKTANAHDAVFADMKRQISEMDLTAVFNEYPEKVITPLLDNFSQLSLDETAKEAEVNDWYEKNVKR
jgi:hypothetical protein